MKRIQIAKQRLHGAKRDVSRYREWLEEQEHLAGQSRLRRYFIQAIFLVASAAAAIWYLSQIPHGHMDNGGNWAGGASIIPLGVFLCTIGSVLDARYHFKAAPARIDEFKRAIIEASAEVARCTDLVATEEREYARRQALPDAALTLAGTIGEATLRFLEDSGRSDSPAVIQLRAAIAGLSDNDWDNLTELVGSDRAAALRASHASLLASQKAQACRPAR